MHSECRVFVAAKRRDRFVNGEGLGEISRPSKWSMEITTATGIRRPPMCNHKQT